MSFRRSFLANKFLSIHFFSQKCVHLSDNFCLKTTRSNENNKTFLIKMLRRGAYSSSSSNRQTFTRIFGVSCFFSAATTVVAAVSAQNTTSSMMSSTSSSSLSSSYFGNNTKMFRFPSSPSNITQCRYNSSSSSSNNNSSNSSTSSKPHPKFTVSEAASQGLKVKAFAERAKLAYVITVIGIKFVLLLLGFVILYRIYQYVMKYYERRQVAIDAMNQQFEKANATFSAAVQTKNGTVDAVKEKSAILIEQGKAHLPVLKEQAEKTRDMIQSQITPEMKDKAVEVKEQMKNKVSEFLEERKKKL